MPVRRIGIIPALLFILASGCDSDRKEAEKDQDIPEPVPAPIHEVRTKGGPVMAPPPLLSQHAAQLPDSGFQHDDGLEHLDWTVADYGNPAQVYRLERIIAGQAQQKAIRLAVELFGGPKYSTALTCEGRWRLSTAEGAETVVVIYNDAQAALQVGWAFKLSEKGIWHESRPFTLKPGWNTIRIPQSSSDFKSEATQWQHRTTLRRADDCRGLVLLIHNGQRTGRLFIDHINVAEQPAGGL